MDETLLETLDDRRAARRIADRASVSRSEWYSYGAVVLHVLVDVEDARTELAMELRDRGVGPEFLPPATA